jgi:hypothetical protein
MKEKTLLSQARPRQWSTYFGESRSEQKKKIMTPMANDTYTRHIGMNASPMTGMTNLKASRTIGCPQQQDGSTVGKRASLKIRNIVE